MPLTDEQRQRLAKRLQEDRAAMLRALDRASERFGICEARGEQIPLERLGIIP